MGFNIVKIRIRQETIETVRIPTVLLAIAMYINKQCGAWNHPKACWKITILHLKNQVQANNLDGVILNN